MSDGDQSKQSELPQREGPALDLPRMIVACAIALGSLLAGGAVAYHFLVYLPERDARQALNAPAVSSQQPADGDLPSPSPTSRTNTTDFARQEESRRQSQAAHEASQQAARRAAYQECLQIAEENYSNDWDRECRANSDRNTQSRNTCLEGAEIGSVVTLCWRTYPETPSTNCRLPRETAMDLEARLEAAKSRCLQEMSAGL